MSSTDSPPGAQEQKSANISYSGKEYTIAREGLAEILIPKTSAAQKAASQTVFYNPIQQFNRDLSVLAIRVFGDDLAAIRRAKQLRHLQNDPSQQRKNRKRKWEENQDTQLAKEAEPLPMTERIEKINRSADQNALALTLEHSEMSSEVSKSNPDGDVDSVDTAGSGQRIANATIPQNGGREAVIKVEASFEAHSSPSSHPSYSSHSGRPISTGPRSLEPDEQKATKPPFRVLDALSATGLRALRYVQEIPSITSVTANDLSATATTSIKLNVAHNGLADRINTVTGNASALMYRVATDAYPILPGGSRGRYEVIDLDPYGSAAPFLDAAVQALSDGGLLCVTCTDASIFASLGYLEKTFSLYGGLPIKGPHAHEGGLRLILHAIATSAARHGIAIEPLLSLSIDFYARVFVRIHRAPKDVKHLAAKTMVVYNCDEGCGSWTTQFVARASSLKSRIGETVYGFHPGQGPTTNLLCEHCGFKRHVAGPMWGGPLHNPHFIQRILDILPTLDKTTYGTIPRIEGMLTIAKHEVPAATSVQHPSAEPEKSASGFDPMPRVDPAIQDTHPFFVIPSSLSRVLHCTAPSDSALRGALIGLGYQVSRSHTKPGSIRTTAPWNVIWEVMREWVRQKAPLKSWAIAPRTSGWGVIRGDRRERARALLSPELRRILEKDGHLDEVSTLVEAALSRASKASEKPMESDSDAEESLPAPESERDVSLLKVVFDESLGKDVKTKKLVRYQLNPRAGWGPMTKAKGDHD